MEKEMLKPKTVRLQFIKARSEEFHRWRVLEVTNSLNPAPGDTLEKDEVMALIRHHLTTVEIQL